MKITTERQQNEKLLYLLNEESNLFNAIREKTTISRQNWTPLH